MKAVTYRRTLAVALGIAITVSLAACSDSSRPSESEAKQALQSYLGNCQYVKVQDFKRINGIAQQDGSYVVQASYTLDIQPSDDVRSYVHDRFGPGGVDQQIADAKQQLANHDQAQSAWLAANSGKTVSDYYYSLSPEDRDRYGVARAILTQDSYGPAAKIDLMGRNAIIAMMAKECPSTGHFFAKLYSDSNYRVEEFSDDIERKAENVEIRMIRTDNGWQLAQ